MKLTETQSFKDGYLKARQEKEQVYNKLLNLLDELEKEANEILDDIPEEFEDLQDSEDYNYYSGVLIAVKRAREILGE